jgi:hypothetical protein
MEPVSAGVAATSLVGETADALHAMIAAVPTGGADRRWRRARRERAYLAFQQAALDAATWVPWLSVLEQTVLAREVTVAQIMPEVAGCRSALSGLLGD